MLMRVKVGSTAEAGTLVLTPEFLEMAKEMGESGGIYIRTRFYPWARNWIVVSRLPKKRMPPVMSFRLRGNEYSFPVFIPIKQGDIFDGKVVGREMNIVNAPVGFLGA